MDRIIQMILNKVLSRVINRAVDGGINFAARGGKAKSDMTDSEKVQDQQAKDMTKRVKDVRQVTRRLF